LNEAAQNCSEKHSLVVEVQKNRPLGNFRPSRHVVEAGGRIPVERKLFECSRQDLFPSLCFSRSSSNGLLDGGHLPILALLAWSIHLTDRSVKLQLELLGAPLSVIPVTWLL
jgi:hypothetical protein